MHRPANSPDMNRHAPIRSAALAVLLLIAIPWTAFAQGLKDTYSKIEYRIPMRDGVELYTAVYVPRSKPGKHPILLERTPYGAGPYGAYEYRGGLPGSRQFAEAGYVFAFQDVRGRGQSKGTYVNIRPQLIVHTRPLDIDESTDAWDTVDYLVKHVPDNNGRVGVWGVSYPGFYAATAAMGSHPALRAASPQAPVSDWFIGDDFHRHGALFLMDAVGFARFGESSEAGSHSMPNADAQGDPWNFYLKNGTLAGLTDTYFKHTDGCWKDLRDHPNYDEYWQSRSTPHLMREVHCPVMAVGGWFDAEDCWGALHVGQATRDQNPTVPTTLVMGPWSHGGWAGGSGDSLGNMTFGQSTSEYYREQVEFPFFDACLRGGGKPSLPAAVVFETGANRWRTFDTWPPEGAEQQGLFLQAGKTLAVGGAPLVFGADYDEYESDPANPVPYQGGKITQRTADYMVDDQRFADGRKDVLTYRSAPLTAPLTIAGALTADLYVSTSGSDADFVVKVIDVFPDNAEGKLAGYQNLLRADVMRGRFRDSYQNPQPMTPGKVTHVEFAMTDLLHTFLPGHRIMVQVQSSWFPLADRNPQTFVDIWRAKPEDFRKATMRVYHSASRPSCVRIGVIPTLAGGQ